MRRGKAAFTFILVSSLLSTSTTFRLALWNQPHKRGHATGFFQNEAAGIQGSRTRPLDRGRMLLFMALTPVGPFCPFRSSAALAMEDRMNSLNSKAPEFATEMTRLQLDMQLGEMPNPDRLNRVANGLEQSVDEWELLVTRLRLSSDFQTREYAKLTQAHLDNHNTTTEQVASMMKWQAACMRAMANNVPPPMPPAGVDLAKLMEEANNNQQQQQTTPSVTAMAAAETITAVPFTDESSAFESPTVKLEYERLCRDHSNLIEFGGKYASFDPLGKIYYLDEVDKIQDRWDVFFARFQLMGKLNQLYIQQCNAFLASMSMNEDEYRKLLQKCHEMMRQEAHAERNQIGV